MLYLEMQLIQIQTRPLFNLALVGTASTVLNCSISNIFSNYPAKVQIVPFKKKKLFFNVSQQQSKTTKIY